MNNSISHILDIYRLVAQKHFTQLEAAREVAKKRNMDHGELIAACARDLNISVDKLGYFLESRNDFNFKNFLFRRFPEYQEYIDRFFLTFEEAGDIPVLDLSKIIKSSRNGNKSMNSQIIISSLKDKFLDWISRPDIPQDVKEELKGWMSKING